VRRWRRAVPGLHQAGVELVEGLPLGLHGVVARPGSGTIIHRVRQLAAGQREQLEDVVELAESEPVVSTTVRIFIRSLPKSFERIIAWRACIQLMLPRRVLISPCARCSGRVGPRPGGECGGEALVHHRDRRDDRRVDQVEIEAAQLAALNMPL